MCPSYQPGDLTVRKQWHSNHAGVYTKEASLACISCDPVCQQVGPGMWGTLPNQAQLQSELRVIVGRSALPCNTECYAPSTKRGMVYIVWSRSRNAGALNCRDRRRSWPAGRRGGPPRQSFPPESLQLIWHLLEEYTQPPLVYPHPRAHMLPE